MQVAEVVAQVLLQAQTDVLVEVAADPNTPPQAVDSAVAQAGPLPSVHPPSPPLTLHTSLHAPSPPLTLPGSVLALLHPTLIAGLI